MPDEDYVNRGVNGGRWRASSDLEIDDLVLEPVQNSESAHVCHVVLNILRTILCIPRRNREGRLGCHTVGR